jgi:hypothetical protein
MFLFCLGIPFLSTHTRALFFVGAPIPCPLMDETTDLIVHEVSSSDRNVTEQRRHKVQQWAASSMANTWMHGHL